MAKRKLKTAPRGYPKGDWSPQALKVLRERYLWKDKGGRIIETPEGMCYRVAKEMAEWEANFGKGKKEIEKITRAFYEILVKREFLPNSPTLMNAGKGIGLQYAACYVLPVGDSIIEIFEAIKNAALVHQSGGGTGFAFSRLRPMGSVVRRSGGVASGPVSFMKIFDAATQQIKQGGRRRGANMGVLRVDHPDILEFIDCKKNGGITNFNISVGATEEFMKALKTGKKYGLVAPHSGKFTSQISAREVFRKIVESAWLTGDPGMIWLDRINQGRANPVPSMGPVEATNPCVVGSTLVATEKGLVDIEKLVKKKMEINILTDNRVLGGEGLTFRKHNHLWDNGSKEVWRLITKSGFELEATADHKIMTSRGFVPLKRLRLNEDKVLIQAGEGAFNQDKSLPFIPENKVKGKNGRTYYFKFPTEWSQELGQVLGWLVGDGWLRRGDKNYRVGFSFSQKDRKIRNYLQKILNQWYGQEIRPVKREREVFHLSYHSKFFADFFEKLGVKPVKAREKEVPRSLFLAPKEAVIGFLQGLFSADGTINIYEPNDTKYIRLTSKSETLLKQVQLLLLNLGIKSQIFNRSRKPRKIFPYTNKNGQLKTYLTDGVCFELNLSREAVPVFLKTTGFLKGKHAFKIEKLKEKGFYPQRFTDTVVSLISRGREHVFDLTERVTSSFIANGIVVSNCGEQPLYPNEVCNLGSINLALMVKDKRKKEIDWSKLEKVIRLGVRFLDNVVDVNPYPVAEVAKTAKLNRRIGLGVMGWSDLLFQLEIPYASQKAISLGERTSRFIQRIGHQESQELARERGPFPNFEKSIYKEQKPLRNATVTTIAPTGSISVIADCSSGIEPVFALAFQHKTEEREMSFVNQHFLEAAKAHKIPKAVIEKVKDDGQAGGMREIPLKLRRLFQTAHEIPWEYHVKMQAAWQEGTDNAVSKTINFPHETRVEGVEKAFLLAYKTGCVGITVFRDHCKEDQVLYLGLKGRKPRKLEIKPRPSRLQGMTHRIPTPVGNAFITINTDENGEPFEVFVGVGKAGSDLTADAEAIGRLISLNLRTADANTKEMLTQVVDQLADIGGTNSVGFGKNRVKSLPDGVAKVLRDFLVNGSGLADEKVTQPPLSFKNGRDLCPTCGQASLIFEEGCAKCLNCGFTKC